jgi:deoxyribose-phosphate aldolase
MISPARYIDHTLLKADATADQIRRLCEEAVEFGFASVCIPPVYVPLAAAQLYGSEVAVGTVVGFPLGYSTVAAKICETREAVAAGAGEIDMVIHLGAALAGHLRAVEAEIRGVTKAACSARVKVILECCYLDDPLKSALVERVVAGGASYVKTSTGFGSGGATEADVRLLAAASAGRIGVKAAGGIRDWATCRTLLAAGATRIGSSSGISMLSQWRLEEGQ